MTKFAGVSACLIAALDSIGNALGDQVLFAPQFAWIFWFGMFAFLWGSYRLIRSDIIEHD